MGWVGIGGVRGEGWRKIGKNSRKTHAGARAYFQLRRRGKGAEGYHHFIISTAFEVVGHILVIRAGLRTRTRRCPPSPNSKLGQ